MEGASASESRLRLFERISIIAEGRSVVNGSPLGISSVSPSHLSWIERLLVESPASLQDIVLENSPDGKLTLEWQSVFQGVGFAYFRTSRGIIAVCLLLHGCFPTSERAAIDAAQHAVQSVHNRNADFDFVRRHDGRPLRATVIVEEPANPEASSRVEYWCDCLALAYFNMLGASIPAPHRDIKDEPGHRASAV